MDTQNLENFENQTWWSFIVKPDNDIHLLCSRYSSGNPARNQLLLVFSYVEDSTKLGHNKNFKEIVVFLIDFDQGLAVPG